MKKPHNETDSRAEPLRFLDLEFDATGSSSIKFNNLPLLTLETMKQRTALDQLIPAGKFNGVTRQFQDHVLRFLALIADKMHVKGKADVISRRSQEALRKIRRRAKRVRTFVGILESPFGQAIPAPPAAPIDGLRHYAQELDRYADSIQSNRDGLVRSLLGTSKSKKRPPRNTKKVGNELIADLAGLVRNVTGEDHYDELTILLRRATGDSSYNNHRLQSLCWVDRERKKKRGRIATAFARQRTI